MFVPPDLEFYPQLITQGPLKSIVRRLIQAVSSTRPAARKQARQLLAQYRLRRYDLGVRVLRAGGVGWCDDCRKLVAAKDVRSVFRHGTYIYMKTDCSYGAPFESSSPVRQVVALCSLHGEIHEGGNDIWLSPVIVQGSSITAAVNGMLEDVTDRDERHDPSDYELERLGLVEKWARGVPPMLELTWNGTLQMLGNPYVVLAKETRHDQHA